MHDPGDFPECLSGDNDYEARFHMVFNVEDEDSDHLVAGSVSVSTHLHNVPPDVVVQSLVITAQRMLADYLAKTQFDSLPDSLALVLAESASTTTIRGILDATQEMVGAAFSVPNDARELMGD